MRGYLILPICILFKYRSVSFLFFGVLFCGCNALMTKGNNNKSIIAKNYNVNQPHFSKTYNSTEIYYNIQNSNIGIDQINDSIYQLLLERNKVATQDDNVDNRLLIESYDNRIATLKKNQEYLGEILDDWQEINYNYIKEGTINYTDEFSINNGDQDFPLMRISNYTIAPGATDWSTTKKCNLGDIITVSFYFHNSGMQDLINLRLYLEYESFITESVIGADKTNILILTAILKSDDIDQITAKNAYFFVEGSKEQIQLQHIKSYWSDLYKEKNEYVDAQYLPDNQIGTEVFVNGFEIRELQANDTSKHILRLQFKVDQLEK